MDEIEKFFGCYLLYCMNPKYKGQTYIGFTVDPNRRIKQHNKGLKAGGAYRTSSRGPWEMVLVVHGFPNDISALRFEWAWQHPKRSRRLRNITGKCRKESAYEYRFRILSEMLRMGPWNKLPLTIRWLTFEMQLDFRIDQQPPNHMPIVHGPVKCSKGKLSKENDKDQDGQILCSICLDLLETEAKIVRCLNPKCRSPSHLACLANYFLSSQDSNSLLPVEGNCPKCLRTLLWGDIISYYMGCYRNCLLLEDNTS